MSASKGGFTIVEVLVSVGIMLIFLPFVASMLISTQVLASYSKHKIQSAYAAKQIIEQERQLAVLNNTLASPVSSQVVLDTKGIYTNNCNTGWFCGTSLVTVTPVVYPNNPGTTVDHVVVQISWNEQILKNKVVMNDTYATDIIINDAMLN